MDPQQKAILSKHSVKFIRNETKKKSQIIERLEKHLYDKNIDSQLALDNLIYGIICLRVLNKATTENIVLSLDINDSTILKIIYLKHRRIEKIKLAIFQDVDFDLERGSIKKLSKKKENIISESSLKKNYITLLTTKKETYDFVFYSSEDLDNFTCSFLHILNSNIYEQEENLNERFIESIRNIWIKYDKNFSGKLDMEEFKYFAKELNLILNKTFSIKELFKSIDKDNSDNIDFDEFINYYKQFTNGEELKYIFDQYSHYNEFYKEKTIGPKSLVNFYLEIQKETIEESEAKILISLIKNSIPQETLDKIKVKLNQRIELTSDEDMLMQLKLSEFKILIYDKSISSVYSSASTETIQDMSKPLNDYFIFSSHNTYLTGHQVYGGSDPEMYSTSLLIGCRLVELDVYNGKNDGPVVKHGFTMTGEILLKDALENIKKSAFVISEYPVILSIENHCNEGNQIKMANLFKEILVDLFVIEDNTDLIKYPSPKQLRRKFMIKAKRKEIFAKKIEANNDKKEIEENKTLRSNSKETKKKLIRNENSISNNLINKFKEKVNPNLNEVDDPKKHVNQTRISRLFNSSQIQNKSIMDNSYLNASQNLKLENLNNTNHLLKIPLVEAKENDSKSVYNDITINNDEAEKIGKEALKQKKQNAPMISKLSETIGMIGRKLHLDKVIEMNYQYWDCVTKKDKFLITKSVDFNSRKNLVEYCKRSFLKAYPTNFSSENYDCIKTWMLGCQISAVNIQKLDCDNFLLNLVFFRQNDKCGLVLKPKHLRDRTIEYSERYLSPKKKLITTLISGYMLNLLGYDDDTNKFNINLKNLRMEIKLVGSVLDDLQKNNSFEILIEQNLLNPHFNNVSHVLDIYETDLSAVFIYIYSNKEVIGRSIIPLCMLAEGLRCVPIYDIKADEFNESRLVFMFEYIKV